jgi:arylsulfatase A-like enzyme
LRFAVRLPDRAELRFTPELYPQARAAAASASFRVTVEERAGEEREVWSRVLGPKDGRPTEVAVALPGAAGAIVRLGLHVGGAPNARFTWGAWDAPRVMGRRAESLEASPVSADDDKRADALRAKLHGVNVLFIILDAARAQQFGSYGYGRATTPEIDRLAQEGAVYEDVFTSAVYTNAAMSSVWTSQYPDRHHGDVSFAAPLPTDRLTLPDVLTGQGIRTGGFVANAVAGALNGFGRGFDEFHETWRELGSRGDVFRQALPPWFKANRERRMFTYVHFREPHFPYDPEPPFDTRFGPDGPIPKAARRDSDFFTAINQGRRPLSPEEREHLVRLYDGNLAFADQEVGAIRRLLEGEGLWDKTVVIVAADHGEALFEHGWIGHNVQLYDPSIHVPLIVRFPPGTGPRGVRVKGLADLLDLAPTIADLLGVRGKGGSERAFQGRSLLPALFGAPGKGLVLSRTVWERPRYSLRDGQFKFIYDTRTGEEELFDLGLDPGERKALGTSERLRASYYRQTLHHWTARIGGRDVGAGGSASGMTREQCENLKALGYISADTKCPES